MQLPTLARIEYTFKEFIGFRRLPISTKPPLTNAPRVRKQSLGI